MKKQLNYADIIKEALILTGAVAIIAAAVYFFLAPSHTSVSSISGLGIVLFVTIVCNYHDFECGTSDHWFLYLRTRIWRKNGLHQYRSALISRIIRESISGLWFYDQQSGTGCAVLYPGSQRRIEHSF